MPVDQWNENNEEKKMKQNEIRKKNINVLIWSDLNEIKTKVKERKNRDYYCIISKWNKCIKLAKGFVVAVIVVAVIVVVVVNVEKCWNKKNGHINLMGEREKIDPINIIRSIIWLYIMNEWWIFCFFLFAWFLVIFFCVVLCVCHWSSDSV